MMSSTELPALGDTGRHLQLLQELVVAEHETEVRVDQDHAIVHVVEDGLHHRAGALDILLGLGQRLLAVLQLGDVAIDAERAAVGQRTVVELDVAAARGAALVAAARRDCG